MEEAMKEIEKLNDTQLVKNFTEVVNNHADMDISGLIKEFVSYIYLTIKPNEEYNAVLRKILEVAS